MDAVKKKMHALKSQLEKVEEDFKKKKQLYQNLQKVSTML